MLSKHPLMSPSKIQGLETSLEIFSATGPYILVLNNLRALDNPRKYHFPQTSDVSLIVK
jgi:hypothetical protein